jgi:hypothetical protein
LKSTLKDVSFDALHDLFHESRVSDPHRLYADPILLKIKSQTVTNYRIRQKKRDNHKKMCESSGFFSDLAEKM